MKNSHYDCPPAVVDYGRGLHLCAPGWRDCRKRRLRRTDPEKRYLYTHVEELFRSCGMED